MSDITTQISNAASDIQKDPQGALEKGKEYITEQGQNLKDQAQQTLGGQSQGSSAVDSAKDTVSQGAQQAQDGASNALNQAKDTVGLK
ncbi:hypothetical protein MCUN1_000334 [Malassezia cuniculi]|uniref:Uncharacterized protein n=1 Tax=Malassezia cuniculi TaxID=948313 RepID=A0AAF0ES60_9BASI|nr:hypothetical protein MCUN1_000334 [Malassezia cuniculi]